MLTVRTIAEAVATFYAVPVADIYSPRRDAPATRARHVTMYLARSFTSRSLPQIGRFLGGRDHTTVLSALRKIDVQRHCEPELVEEINALSTTLNAADQATDMLCVPELEEFDPERIATRVLTQPPARRHLSHDEVTLVCAALLGALGVGYDGEVPQAPEPEAARTVDARRGRPLIANVNTAFDKLESARFSARESAARHEFKQALKALSDALGTEICNVG